MIRWCDIMYESSDYKKEVTDYINTTIDEINGQFPLLIDMFSRENFISTYLRSNKPLDEVKREIDKIKINTIKNALENEKLSEEYQMTATKLEQEKVGDSTTRKNRRFGETLTFQMVELFRILEKLDTTGLNDDAKCERFLNEYDDLKQGFYGNGYQELDYETLKSLKKMIDQDMDIIVDEWTLKMSRTIKEDEPLFLENYFLNKNAIDLSRAKIVCDYAKDHNKELKLHTIIWHQAFPVSLKPYLENKSKEEKEQITLSFINQYLAYLALWTTENSYQFTQIDVLNEIASDSKDRLSIYRDSPWTLAFGIEPLKDLDDLSATDKTLAINNHDEACSQMYATILSLVRTHFPTSELIYNEYNEFLPHKCSRIIKIINSIKSYESSATGSLLDGFGMQSHYTEYYVEEKDSSVYEEITPRMIYQTTKEYASTGLNLHRSEMDFYQVNKDPEKRLKLEEAIRFADTVNDTRTIILWNNNETISWRAKKGLPSPHMVNRKGEPNKNYIYYLNHYSRLNYQRNKNNGTSYNNSTTANKETTSDNKSATSREEGYTSNDMLTIIIGFIIISLVVILSSIIK